MRVDTPSVLGGLSTHERALIRELASSETPGITADDVIAIQSMARPTANQVLTRLHRKGWLRRVRRGVYVVVPITASDGEAAIEDAWPLAMKLFAPCFISGWSAAEHWDLTEQIFNAIAVVTTSPQRKAEQHLNGVSFRTRVVPESRFFGAKPFWFGSQRVTIADPHRTVIDILDDPSFGGGGRQAIDIVRAYWMGAQSDANVVLDYARRLGNGAVLKRLGFTAEKYGRVDNAWLDECRSELTAGVANLDPVGPHSGTITSRWRLRINMPLDES